MGYTDQKYCKVTAPKSGKVWFEYLSDAEILQYTKEFGYVVEPAKQ